MVEGFDRGVRDWVIEYHAQVTPVQRNGRIFISKAGPPILE